MALEPALAAFIDKAANIAASGKWDALNDVIARLAANPGSNEAWHVHLLGALWAAVSSEYLQLKRARKQEGDSALLAWRARNLLELGVWCEYCSRSKQNARRLYEDAGRDVMDIVSAYEKWGAATQQSGEWLHAGTNAVKQQLLQRAAAEGIADLEGTYKAVHNAAKECGFEEDYRIGFKTLSKFAHPTAMQILAPPDEVRDARQKDVFFSKGCMFFAGAFGTLEQTLNELLNSAAPGSIPDAD